MKTILAILVFFMIAKDTSQLNDPFIMRSISQVLCLLAGALMFLKKFSASVITKYIFFYMYIITLLLSLINTDNYLIVFVQIVSLFSVIIFFIGYYENINGYKNNKDKLVFINYTIYGYLAVTVISLYAMLAMPSIAYDQIDLGNVAGFGSRFRGLFSKSGMMASAAGILLGLVLFSRYKIHYKLIMLLPPVMCVFFTKSRTFWVASIIAIALTYILYSKGKKTSKILLFSLSFLVGGVLINNYLTNVENYSEELRIDSLKNLSGRLDIWQYSLEIFQNNILIGNGYTQGAVAFSNNLSSYLSSSGNAAYRDVAKITLHNGYIQCLLDAGLLGSVVYISLIIGAIYKMIKYDVGRIYPQIFYLLIFCAIANMGETLIYTASVYHSIVYWAAAIFAFSLTNKSYNIKASAYHK